MAALAERPTDAVPAVIARTGRTVHLTKDDGTDRTAAAADADVSRLVPPDPIAGYTRASEKAALRAALESLAAIEAEQRQTDEDTATARARGERGKAADLATHAEMLKADHAKLRGAARVGILSASDAVTMRAAAEYVSLALLTGAAAARYMAFASQRDDLTGTTRRTFDPLNLWGLSSGLLAPELAHRPRGWFTVVDHFGREMVWHPSSPAHVDAMRKHQESFKAEVMALAGGARWPF